MDAAEIAQIRWADPSRIADALRSRPAPEPYHGKLLVIAADHPARGALTVGDRVNAMADRSDLLQRIDTALSRPGVHGFLGTADLVEDLALMGSLDGKLVYGSMNRGGLAGAAFEMDDRFTGYTVPGIVEAGLDGGKMLLRVDPDDPGSVATLESTAHAVSALADARRIAMVEPFMSRRTNGKVVNDLSTEAVVKSIAIASGLGASSAYTWLKIPCADDMARVASSTTLPLLVLGGDVASGSEDRWIAALAQPTVRGLVIGRSLLYPPDDDVTAAVDRVAALT